MITKSIEKPLISVIIPTYNRAKIIDIPLKSVLAQTYKNIEIVVVDDRSTDNTKDVIDRLNDSRIRYICHSTNRGGAVARNTGIDAAKGEYIAFLDSDDAWVANKLELQLARILQHSHPKKIVSYTGVFHSLSGITEETYSAFDEQFFLPKRGKNNDETISDYLFCYGGKTLSSTLMLHRSLAVNTRFQDSLRKHQDWDFCLRLEAAGATFSFIEQPLTIWNGDPSFEHVGRTGDYLVSESFFDRCRAYFTPKAMTAFLLNKIIPSLMTSETRKLYCQKIALIALLQKLISFKRFRQITARLWRKQLNILRKIKSVKRVFSS